MRVALILMLGYLLSAPAVAEDSYYECHTADGQLRLTDRPCANGERHELPPPNTSQPVTDPTLEAGARWADDSEFRRQQRAARPAHATGGPDPASVAEQERLQRACKIERASILRHRDGTPSCDQLDRVYGRQVPTRIIINGDSRSRW